MRTDPPSAIREGQLRSAFTCILETLCESCVGSMAAGLIDAEGECVDHASVVPEGAPSERMVAYDIKLAGAYWQITMRQASEQPHLSATRQIDIHAAGFDYVALRMFDGYVLLLIGRPGAIERVSPRAIRQVEVELSMEAGWPVPEPARPYWRRVRVRLDSGGRPSAMSFLVNGQDGTRFHGAWESDLRVHDAWTRPGFERGFRLSTPGGDELDLVRERTGFWYAARELQPGEIA